MLAQATHFYISSSAQLWCKNQLRSYDAKINCAQTVCIL